MPMSADRADATLTDVATGAHVWVHTADPGASGTANVAQTSGADVARKPVSFAAVENHPSNTERRVLSDAAVEWSAGQIDESQTLTHFTIWDALTGGQVEHIAALTSSATTGSEGARFSASAIELAIQVFKKP